MSFDDLRASDVTRKIEDITISIGENGEKTLNFKAKEISYLQRLHIAQLQKTGGDSLTQLIVYSIVDEAGKHMTLLQAEALSDEHAVRFFTAVSRVNGFNKKADESAEDAIPKN